MNRDPMRLSMLAISRVRPRKPCVGVLAQYIRYNKPGEDGQDYDPAQPILGEQRGDMRLAPLQVGPRREDFLTDEGLVGGQEHEGRGLRFRRARYLVRPRAPLGLQQK